MFISICYITLPVFVLIHSVNSVDLYRSKRVPRELEEVQTRYFSNHPPLQEQHIPVSVIYDDEEDIRIITKSSKETTPSISESKITLPSSIRNSDKPVVLTLKAQFANNPPVVEAYDTIPVAIVTDDVEKNNRDSTNEERSVSEDTDQQKSIETDKTTNVEEQTNKPKPKKPQGRSVNIEATTSSSDTNVNVTVKNIRKPSQRRRLHRVINANVNKNQASLNEKSETTPTIYAKGQTNEKLENSSQPIRSSQQTNENPKNNSLPIRSSQQTNEKPKNNSLPIRSSQHSNEKPKNNSQPIRSSQFQKRTQQPEPIVPIVDSENYVYAYNGDYHYSYEGGDGTKAYERGEQLKTAEGSSSGNGVVGGFSYTDKDGNDFNLSYTADENGYRPIGAHLPTPPPIPPAIQRALDFLATKTTPEPITERVNKLN